ncbi:hypothetical protein HNR21_001902 [Actinomadura cellulosilytica]|uniref:Transposase IS4 N-terminal domain-containing protein n=1 Tax=Thermomonospora cellulosilytica TaxID=1411118 RepID=A0A7W3MW50_9ACTN|nr:hypothetical protein [Thermomonospora cellulosilytica]
MPVHARIAGEAAASPSAAGLRGHLLDRLTLGAVTELIPPWVVDEVISGCGRGDKRVRVLPARVTFYFVLALWLCPGAGYGEVLRVLFEQFHHQVGAGRIRVPTGPAAVQARRRLGREPVKVLFRRLCGAHAGRDEPGMSAFGCRLALLKVAVDGTTLDVPDTVANRTAFGSAPGRSSTRAPCIPTRRPRPDLLHHHPASAHANHRSHRPLRPVRSPQRDLDQPPVHPALPSKDPRTQRHPGLQPRHPENTAEQGHLHDHHPTTPHKRAITYWR